MAGTDWSIVSTSDGKKYYYDNKQKVRSRPWLRATLGAVWMGATARHSVAGVSGATANPAPAVYCSVAGGVRGVAKCGFHPNSPLVYSTFAFLRWDPHVGY